MPLPFLMNTEELLTAGAVASLAAAGATAYAGMSHTSQIFGRCVVAPRHPRQIALTYDDGPNDPATPRLLELLSEQEIRATFFLIGRFARLRPDLVRAIAAAGHLIGNHTMTHPALLLCSAHRVRAELRQGNAALEDALGTSISAKPIQWFRPPFGARRPYVLRAARELGLTPVLWNAMGHDWKPTTPEVVAAHVWRGFERNQQRGLATNVLLHDGGHGGMGQNRNHTVAATRMLLERWKRHFAECGERCEFVTPEAWV